MRFTVFILLLASYATSSATTLTGHVVRVTDGDTIVILSEGNLQHRIRLQGIDAPERSQAFGNKSREHLSKLVASRLVIVEYDKRERYGRIVGKVLVGGEDSCLEQIAAGGLRIDVCFGGMNKNGDRLRKAATPAFPAFLY